MAMKQGNDLPAGYYFECAIGTDAAYNMPQIILVAENGYVDRRFKVECFFARQDYDDAEAEKELGYKCYDMRRIDSDPGGFGPLVAEIAIEWTTLLGGILFPDRREMSKSAQRMWNKFSGRPGFEEFIHPTLGTKGYRRPPARGNTIKKLEAVNQLFRRRGTGQSKEFSRLSRDFQ